MNSHNFKSVLISFAVKEDFIFGEFSGIKRNSPNLLIHKNYISVNRPFSTHIILYEKDNTISIDDALQAGENTSDGVNIESISVSIKRLEDRLRSVDNGVETEIKSFAVDSGVDDLNLNELIFNYFSEKPSVSLFYILSKDDAENDRYKRLYSNSFVEIIYREEFGYGKLTASTRYSTVVSEDRKPQKDLLRTIVDPFEEDLQIDFYDLYSDQELRLINELNTLDRFYNGKRVLIETPKGIDVDSFLRNCFKPYVNSKKREFKSFKLNDGTLSSLFKIMQSFYSADNITQCLLLENVDELSLSSQKLLFNKLRSIDLERHNVKDSLAKDFMRRKQTFVFFTSSPKLIERCRQELFDYDLYYLISKCLISIESLHVRGMEVKRDYLNQIIRIYSNFFRVEELRLSEGSYQRLLEYDYPGNIKEMSLIISRLYIQKELGGDYNQLNDLPFLKEKDDDFKPTTNLHLRLMPHVKKHIESLLMLTNGHIGNSAKLAGLAVNTFKQKMEECEVDIEYFKKKGT